MIVVERQRRLDEDAPSCGETTNFNDDIVFVDGQFVQYPAGSQN